MTITNRSSWLRLQSRSFWRGWDSRKNWRGHSGGGIQCTGGGCVSVNVLNCLGTSKRWECGVLLIDPRTRLRHHPEFVVDDIWRQYKKLQQTRGRFSMHNDIPTSMPLRCSSRMDVYNYYRALWIGEFQVRFAILSLFIFIFSLIFRHSLICIEPITVGNVIPDVPTSPNTWQSSRPLCVPVLLLLVLYT
jgi:hypothetical protein